MFEKLSVVALAVAATLYSSGVSACSCRDDPAPNYDARIRGIDRISEYEVTAVRSVRGGWIATARALHDWKSDAGPKVFEVFHEDNSCDGKPVVGSSDGRIVPLYFNKTSGRYSELYCSSNIPPAVLQEYDEGRRAFAERARNAPDDVEAQIAWVADLNFWHLHRVALSVLTDLERRFPDNPRIGWEKAVALAALGRLVEAQALNYRALQDPSLDGRSNLLHLDIEARRARAKAAGPSRTGRIELGRGPQSLRGQDLSRFASWGWTVRFAIDAKDSNWREAQLVDVGIDGIVLAGANLERATFTRSSLDGADLEGVKAAQAHFRNAHLSGADLRGIVAPSADFIEANLTRADLGGGDFTQANFLGAKLQAARLDGSRFDQANLERADLSGSSSKGVGFVKANLTRADLRGADLSAADLRDAELDGALLDCATRLPETFDRSRALLVPTQACAGSEPVDFRAFDADRLRGGRRWSKRPNFEEANLTGAHFEGMAVEQSYIGAVLDGAHFSGADFDRVALKDISARGADFTDVFGRISISRSDLSDATIIGRSRDSAEVDILFDGSKLDGAVVRNVVLSVSEGWSDARVIGITSTEGTTIEETEVRCLTSEPALVVRIDGESARDKEGRRRILVDRHIAALQFARTLAARSDTNRLEPACERAIENALGGGCAAGRIAMKYDYACPTTP